MEFGKVSNSDYLDMTGTVRQPPDTTYLDMSGRANSTLHSGYLRARRVAIS